MKKYILIIAISLSLIGLLADGVLPNGTGTENDPYQIATLDNLLWLSTTPDVWDDNAFFIQTADIDASPTNTWNGGEGFHPIGTYIANYNPLNSPFTGSYDGLEHSIEGLYINRPTSHAQGLFGWIYNGVISNLGVINANVTGDGRISGLVGLSSENSQITNCYSTGNVTGSDAIGGLIGWNSMFSSITNSYSTVNVTGNSYIGGLVGRSYYSSIINSYSIGNVIANSYVGGLLGWNYASSIKNSYSTGSVTGNTLVGGLVGENFASSTDGQGIENSYSTGSVTGSGNYVGGLIGNNGTSVTSACFWDTETSGQSTSADGTGKTTVEMLDILTYTDAGWDFENESDNGDDDIWCINSLHNNGYPYLARNSQLVENDEPGEQILEPTLLIGNYPNPFNPTTTISFNVKSLEIATLEIFNIKGQLVKQYPAFKAGSHNIVWHGEDNNGKTVGSGVYFYRLSNGKSQQTRKMLMLK